MKIQKVLLVVFLAAAILLSACDVVGGGDVPAPTQTARIETRMVEVTPTPTLFSAEEVSAQVALTLTAAAEEAAVEAPPSTPTTTATAEPAANLGLDYQDDGAQGCATSAHPEEYPACWIQKAQVGDEGVTPTSAIIAIQQLATDAGAEVFDKWTSLEVHPHQPTLVWCPAGDCQWIPDTAFPLLGTSLETRWHQSIGIVQPHPASDPAAIRTITCPAGDCWAVLLH